MHDIVFAIVLAIGTLVACLLVCMMLMQPAEADSKPRNAYWPFTVELQVRDL